MPYYLYQNPETKEVKEIWQGMNETHTYMEDGKPWQRIFTSPNTCIDGVLSNVSQQKFVEKTANMKGTVGDILDYSAELSERRAERNGGTDPVKKKHFEEYKQKVGKKHLADVPKKIETKSAIIEF